MNKNMLVSEYTMNKPARGTGFNGARDLETPLRYSSLRDPAPKQKINQISKVKDKSRDQSCINCRGDQCSHSRGVWKQRSPIRMNDSKNLSPEYNRQNLSKQLESSFHHPYASNAEFEEHHSNFPDITSRRPNIRKRPISVSRKRSSRANTPKPSKPEKSTYTSKNCTPDILNISPTPDRITPIYNRPETAFEAHPPTTSKPKHMRRKSDNIRVCFPMEALEEDSENLKVPIQQTASIRFKRATARRLTDMTGSQNFIESVVSSTNCLDILVESTFSLENKSSYHPVETQHKTESTTPEQRTGSTSPNRSKTYKQQIIQERLPKQVDKSQLGISKSIMLTDSTCVTSHRTENSLVSLGSSQMISASLSREEATYTISLNESTETDRSPIQKSETIVRSTQKLIESSRLEVKSPNPRRDFNLGLFFDPLAKGVHGITKRWKVSKNIGNGGISQVYKAMDVNLGTIFAVKRISYTAELTTNLRIWEQEIKILEKYKHPNIIQYLGSECETDQLYIYLEYADGGSLSSLLNRIGPFEENTVKNYAGQILRGLSYLHKNNIIHRDIKAENVLLDRETIKLSDFGCSRQYSDRTKSGMINSVAGTFLFMAPEVIRSEHYGRSIDIWSLGCLMIQLLTAGSPWPEFDSVYNGIYRIATGLMPTIPDSISRDAQDFIKCCLSRDPSLRKTANELLEHKFIVS